jgi:hypothetical protein
MRIRILAAVLGVLLCAGTGSAQSLSSGSVEGTVLDPQGAAVPAANITAKNTATSGSFTTTTDESGFFRFPVLPVGKYDLTIEKSGFATLTQKEVIVTVGSKVNLPVSLQLAGQVSVVTVTGETPVVETTRTQVSATVAEKSIASLPVNGRNFIDFVLLTPGVTRDVRLGDISFAGQRGTLNSLIVDGSDNNNTFFGQTIGRTGSGRAPYQFSQDSVQEFQVNSNSYSAELGRAGGAVINVVTKSGSNEWHGMGFWYFRDRAMNAKDLIDNNAGRPKSPYHFNQFGANASGPIVRDKAFFFFNYDGQRNTLPNTVTANYAAYVPSTVPADLAFEQQAIAYLNARAQSWKRKQDQNAYLIKVDWNISPDHLFTARWNNQRFTGGGFENGGVQNSFEHTGDSLVKTDTLTFSLNSTFSPRLINVARFGYLRDKEPGTANSDLPEAAVRAGGQTVLTVGRNFFSPRETTIKRWSWADTMTLVRGRHTFKFGADFIKDDILNFFPGNFSGVYLFNSLANFGRSLAGVPLVGTSDTFTQAFAGTGTTGPRTTPDIFEQSYFAQDEWRIRPSLTLNFGIRYDLQLTTQPEVQNPVALAAGIDTAHLNTDKNNLAPRFGLAWTPIPGSSRLVLRAGYGIFYGRTPSIMVGTAHSNNGINVQTLVFRSNTTPVIPSYPNTICGAPTASPNCPAPTGVTGSAPSIFIMQPDYVQPLVHQGNIGAEMELAKDWGIAVNFLTVRGIHLQRTRDINLGTTTPVTIPFNFGGVAGVVDRFPSTRPITAFGRISQFEATANSSYNGMTFQVNKRFSKNYLLNVAYTLSHVIDDKPDATAVVPFGSDDAKMVQNPLNTRDDRASGENDQRHRFVTSAVWDLNYFDGMGPVAKAVLGGWQLSAIWTWQSGQPYTSIVGADLNSDGNSRYDRVPGVGRNTFRLPEYISFDPRISKTFSLAERLKLQLFGEAFNVFNHPNVTGVNTTAFSRSTSTTVCGTGVTECLVPSASFQRPTFTGGPRILQISAKVSF